MSRSIDDRAALLARAAARREAGALDEAARLFEQAAELDPAAPEPWHHLAHVHDLAGRTDQAEACYRRVLALAPGAAATRRAFATLLLSLGRYPEGFALMEARHELEAHRKPALPYPEWTGGEVAGKRILIWPEQGFGDQIMFARFAPWLQARGAEVSLLCWPPLARLFAGSLGVQVLAAAGAVDFPEPDGWVMCCSLAGRLGLTPDSLPNAPYLAPVSAWARPLPDGFKVGLMTAGNPVYANDANRSLPERAAAQLRELPAQIVDLRPSETGAADFADTAALIARLDLVITVDTAVAHLAGAMGKPCWILLPALATDWRWMRGRRDSPWYPSVRLYRQAAPGDWSAVISEIAADLAALAAGA